MSKEEVQTFFEKFQKDSGKMKQELPEMMASFMAFFQSVMKEGALGVKEKELIALGVGLAERCKPCIYLHVQKCLAAGASREEILEAAAVVIMMRGGPAFTYIPEVINALDALGQ